MTAVRVLGVVLALLGAAVPALAGQGPSLAEVARREAERRKTIKSSAPVLTNESLRRELPPAADPTPAGEPAAPATAVADPPDAPDTPEPPAAGAADEPPAPATGNTEAAWRKRMTDARDALQRSQMFAEALQTRVNALSTDFVNRDDPAQRNVIAADRQKAIEELNRVKQEIATQQKGITAIQDEARKAGVPAGWVR